MERSGSPKECCDAQGAINKHMVDRGPLAIGLFLGSRPSILCEMGGMK